ncbi:hypothetical protein [Amycolatopsis orientalis]|uniref:hypothetical protein n=1 Tax=Amycolatopsis orientalis TaxID=31958 RepID=UPI001378F73B|nr:hypothetical protein [Amycolatopsis orientalis]
MENNDSSQRLCFKCGKKEIDKPHVLCEGCLNLLVQAGANYWQTHQQQGATVVKIRQ